MNAMLSPLEAAREQLSISQLWAMLNLPGKPGRSCRSPFREDRNPSFSIYDYGRKWKDHATGQGGDAVDFVAAACNLSPEEGARRLIELAGVLPHPNERTSLGNFVRSHNVEEEEKARKRKSWPVFEALTREEIKAIAELRGLSVEGVSLGAQAGLLYCANSREGRAWIITDSRRRSAQARRMDGQPWARIGAKAWTLPGSEAVLSIGLREALPFLPSCLSRADRICWRRSISPGAQALRTRLRPWRSWAHRMRCLRMPCLVSLESECGSSIHCGS
jgi:hypothetical protein